MLVEKEKELQQNIHLMIDIDNYISNCEGIIREAWIKVDDYDIIYRNSLPVYTLRKGEKMLINDVPLGFDCLRFIKDTKITTDGHYIKIELYSEMEIENIYKKYLEKNLYYELPNDEYVNFYITEAIDYEEIFKKGLDINVNVIVKLYSYNDFKKYMVETILKNII